MAVHFENTITEQIWFDRIIFTVLLEGFWFISRLHDRLSLLYVIKLNLQTYSASISPQLPFMGAK
jgi:hypothetical protein